jgi:hypothetical protein
MKLALTPFQHFITVASRADRKVENTFRLLLFCACLSEVCYLLLIICSLLPSLHLSSTPLVVGWSRIPVFAAIEHAFLQQAWLSSMLLGATFVGLIGIYIVASFGLSRIALVERARGWLYFLVGTTFLFGVTLLFQPMLFSDDVFTFMFTGRLLSIYHLNPWTTIPASIPHDPYLVWVVSGRATFNVFGPLWLDITAGLSALSSNPIMSLFIFKGFILLTHLLNSLLVWSILTQIAPERRALGTLLYAWSPLALIELAGGGHSEGALLSLLLLATFCYVKLQQRRSRLSFSGPRSNKPLRLSEWLSLRVPLRRVEQRQPQGFVATRRFSHDPGIDVLHVGTLLLFGLALSINLIALLVVPLYIWFDLRAERSIARVSLSFCWQILIILLPELLLIALFWTGAETFFNITSSVDMDHFVHAPVGILAAPLHSLYRAFTPHGLSVVLNPDLAADVTIRASAALIFVVLYANLFSKVRSAPTTLEEMRKSLTADQIQVPGFDVLLSCSGTAVFWYLILISGWFWPWYILWMLWPFVLWRFNTFSSAILVLAGTALFIYAFVGFTSTPLATYQSAIIFGIPLVYLLVVRRRQRHAERTATIHGGRSQTTKN